MRSWISGNSRKRKDVLRISGRSGAGIQEVFWEWYESEFFEAEYLLLTHIGGLLRDGKYTVKVLETKDKWSDITYKEDKEAVVQSFKKLIDDGVYRGELYSHLCEYVENKLLWNVLICGLIRIRYGS